MAADTVCPPPHIERHGAGADIEHEGNETVEDQSPGCSIRASAEELGTIGGLDDFQERPPGAGERPLGPYAVRSVGRPRFREGMRAYIVGGMCHLPGEIGVTTWPGQESDRCADRSEVLEAG
ncbi:hypothetical protein ACFYSW_25380 [Rhodococcus aetherivorans]|uniref:hypothetical protein n=1 Tax=Rhodococcus aetherivorans TaxID=191292 RepID=UPI0036ACCD90